MVYSIARTNMMEKKIKQTMLTVLHDIIIPRKPVNNIPNVKYTSVKDSIIDRYFLFVISDTKTTLITAIPTQSRRLLRKLVWTLRAWKVRTYLREQLQLMGCR